MTFLAALLALIAIALAMALLHSALPRLRAEGKQHMWRGWLLALGLGSIGLDMLAAAMAGSVSPIAALGLAALVAHGALLLHSCAGTHHRWWLGD